LAGSKRSDGLWLFSLEGKIESLPKGSADPTGQPPRPGPPPATAGNAEKGKESYATACVVCHGVNGKGGTHGGPAFTRDLKREAIINVVTHGRNDMPPFGAAFSADQLQDLSAYVLELAAH
jgi:mono/diheme cytochrome c family protein